MAVTIKQIADLAGVSRGTVDRALNNRGRINPEVAEKIQKIAVELGYVSNRKKAGETKNKPKIKIGIVTQLAKSSFMLKVSNGILDAGKELSYRGIELLVKESISVDENDQLRAINELVKQNISGLAVMPVDCDSIRARINTLVEEEQIPVVTFNSDIIGSKRSCFVGLDNRKSGFAAAGLMGMLTQGAGKILVITGFFSNSANSLRVDGFIEEIKKTFTGLELVGVQSSFDDTKEVEKIVLNAMELFPDLSGIFVASGGQAGVYQAFTMKKLKSRPYVIIYDLTPKNEKALLSGEVDFLIDQEGYVQGYRPPIILADMILKGLNPSNEYLYTDIKIMTKYTL